jgi:hypothetical protein
MKRKKNKVEVVPFPEMRPGCTVYKADGNYYGTIASVTDSLISIARENEYMAIPDPFMKDKFEMLILKEFFILVDGKDIRTSEEMVSLLNSIKSEVTSIRKRMDYIGAQQISFFGS